MIKRLFIANRGEIARRIALTARRLGIDVVVPLATGAREPGYLAGLVTEFARFDRADAPAAFLDGDLMVSLARSSGCDAVHPGFGFLSENSSFAEKVVAAGLIWVGPRAEAIRAMGSKAGARAIAIEAGVPVAPAMEIAPEALDPDRRETTLRECREFADRVGYPVLFKAAMGGGGKGMRLARHDGDIEDAATRASSEGRSSFGDGRLVLEKFIGEARHVEAQVMGDHHGALVVLGERDCSVQRRHQKIIEECPAPRLPEATRRALWEAAARLARAVRYDNAGTVEFLYDARRDAFYFLEMNTRLQVEHPVTEEVYGVDLVEAQLRVASGEPLAWSDGDVAPRGHAVETRLYAEDPAAGFAPSPGMVGVFAHGEIPGVRWEVGVEAMSEVSPAFDPMVGKVVAWGATRSEAIARLRQALSSVVLAGPAHNVEYLEALLGTEAFGAGGVTSAWLESAHVDVQRDAETDRARWGVVAEKIMAALASGSMGDGGARRGGNPSVDPCGDRARRIFGESVARRGDESQTRVLSESIHVSCENHQNQSAVRVRRIQGRCSDDQGKLVGFWYAEWDTSGERRMVAHVGGRLFSRTVTLGRTGAGRSTSGQAAHDMTAPVPGKVVAVRVSSGQTVRRGDALFVLESMKMEFEVRAARDGTIDRVLVTIGDQVAAGGALAHWDG